MTLADSRQCWAHSESQTDSYKQLVTTVLIPRAVNSFRLGSSVTLGPKPVTWGITIWPTLNFGSFIATHPSAPQCAKYSISCVLGSTGFNACSPAMWLMVALA